jgi:hypothetical protein
MAKKKRPDKRERMEVKRARLEHEQREENEQRDTSKQYLEAGEAKDEALCPGPLLCPAANPMPGACLTASANAGGDCARTQITLDEAYAEDFLARGGRVMPSSAAAWEELGHRLQTESSEGGVKVVGIDVEGTNHRPPLLVQVAAAGIIVLELPSHSKGLSSGLQKLLHDPEVLKVFCDGSWNDRKALGIAENPHAFNVCDLESLVDGLLGHSKTGQRGLCQIANLSQSQGPRRYVKNKKSQKYFIKVDRGFIRPPKNLSQIPDDSLRYACADAWATLLSWHGLAGRPCTGGEAGEACAAGGERAAHTSMGDGRPRAGEGGARDGALRRMQAYKGAAACADPRESEREKSRLSCCCAHGLKRFCKLHARA